MASDSEIERIRKDTEAWRALMRQLLRYADLDMLNPWELDFLEGNLAKPWLEVLSYRQCECLLDIRDDIVLVSSHRGFSVRYLANGCYENRLDLDEEDEAWIVEVYKGGQISVRKRDARRLVKIAGRLGLIESDWAA